MRSRNKRSLTLGTSCAVHALQDGFGATLYVLLPVLAQAFGLSYAQVGLIRAAKSGAMMVFELPSGILAERWGARALLVFGLACAGAAYLVLPAAASFAVILLILFVSGLGAAFQHSLSSAIITTTFTGAARRTALGAYNASGDVGKLTLAGLFTLAIGLGLAWQPVISLFGTLGLALAFITFFLLRQIGVGAPPAQAAPGTHAPDKPGWGIRDRAGFAALGTLVFVDIAVQAGFLTFLAFLMAEKQVPTSLAVFAVVLTLAGGIFGKFGCGFLANRLGVRGALITVQCLTAAGIAAVLLAPTLIAYFLLPFLGLVLQGSSTITYGSVADMFYEARASRGFAAIYTIASGASVSGPVIFGVIGDRFGLAPALFAMAFAVLASLPLVVLLDRARLSVNKQGAEHDARPL